MDAYRNHDMTGLAALVANGEITPGDLLDLALERMDQVNDRLTAVVVAAEDAARQRIAEGLPDGPFRGVPFLLKDMGCEAVDYPTHEGSRLTRNTRHTADSVLFNRLARTGLVPFGRTAAPENGIGVATEAAVYGAPTRNPWNPDHTPGGSSGGAAAAVAAGIVPGAHGSDGGGSIRIPASCCHLFGFKPGRGRMPGSTVWGGMATAGFLTRSVRDTARLLDATMEPSDTAPLARALDSPPPPLRIAVCDTRLDGTAIADTPRQAVAEAARLLIDLGHHVAPARPEADHHAMIRAWCDIVAAFVRDDTEATLARLGRPLRDDDLEPLGHAVLAHGRGLRDADIERARAVMTGYTARMAAFFSDWDILLTPTLAEPPARIGRFGHHAKDFLAYRLGPGMCFDYSPYCAAFNASGQPAMSVPFAFDGGLPVGIHLAGRMGEDTTLIALAAQIERTRPWDHIRAPSSW